MYGDEAPFKELIGQTITKIEGGKDTDELVFRMSDGSAYRMWHVQDCCESVTVEDIYGDFDDLIGTPVLHAEESTSETDPAGVATPEYRDDSFMWTFYRVTTIKGSVVIRWYGESNGYYSESVTFDRIKA